MSAVVRFLATRRRVLLAQPGRISGLAGLGFLAYPISDLAGAHPGVGRVAWVTLVAGSSIGYVVYAIANDHEDEDGKEHPPDRREVLTVIAALASADVVLTLLDRSSWGSVLNIYVVAFAAMGLVGRHNVVAMLIASIAGVLLLIAAGQSLSDALQQGAQSASLGLALCGFAKIMQTNHELRDAREEIARLAVADERRRFARDVHDLLGHSLSVIAVKSQLAGRLIEVGDERAGGEVAEIESVARGALAEVREAVTGYRRPTLASELASARRALRSAGLEVEAQVTRLELAAEDEAVLAWALREATTNIVRHAVASRVRVLVEARDASTRLEVVDDGSGADAAAADGGAAPGHGNGLTGLGERVAARDGHLEAGPVEHGGYRLAVTLPVARKVTA